LSWSARQCHCCWQRESGGERWCVRAGERYRALTGGSSQRSPLIHPAVGCMNRGMESIPLPARGAGSARGGTRADLKREVSKVATAKSHLTKSRRNLRTPSALMALGVVGMFCGACTHDTSAPPATGQKAHVVSPVRSASSDGEKGNNASIALTLADSGHKVSLRQGASLTVDLPDSKSSPDRWTLLTSGPGFTESGGGVYGSTSTTNPPSQSFEFKWNRRTPFGLVLIDESPKKKVLEPEEFAVTLVPVGYHTK
jgi:hypothetical protein